LTGKERGRHELQLSFEKETTPPQYFLSVTVYFFAIPPCKNTEDGWRLIPEYMGGALSKVGMNSHFQIGLILRDGKRERKEDGRRSGGPS
jgi:hypothetical protein